MVTMELAAYPEHKVRIQLLSVSLWSLQTLLILVYEENIRKVPDEEMLPNM